MRLKIRIPQTWKTASVAGFALTGSGLMAAIVMVSQIAPSILNGQAPRVPTLVLAVEATISLLLVMVGFALMVAGADPFDDASDEFRFIDSDPDAEPIDEMDNWQAMQQELTKVG